jgi:hypothetical protein
VPGHPGYLKILEEMRLLHEKKAADYGSKADPFKNIRAATCLGIEPWKAALLRARDKWSRIEAYIENGSLQNESLEDSLMDGAAYFLIALAMRREKLGIPLNLKKMSDAEDSGLLDPRSHVNAAFNTVERNET